MRFPFILDHQTTIDRNRTGQNVRFGSEADIGDCLALVRSTP